MPTYQLNQLTRDGDPGQPLTQRFFGDDAAMRYAMSAAFPDGCDIWEGPRFVGRVHRPKAASAAQGPARRAHAAADAGETGA